MYDIFINFYSWVEWIIIVEFIVVALFVMATYAIKLFFISLEKINAHFEARIERIFVRMQNSGTIRALPLGLSATSLIVVFIRWDKLHMHIKAWNDIKTEVMKIAILPRALKFARSPLWTHRFWLVKCLGYYMDKNHEHILIRLIFDKFSVVSISAAAIAQQSNLEPIVHALVNKIANEYDHIQPLYTSQLTPSPLLYEVILEKLQHTQRERARIACYRILRQIGATAIFYPLIMPDLYSDNLQLKLAAIRILAMANHQAAATQLMVLLDDPNWMVRNAAIQSLAPLVDKSLVLTALEKAISDESWWVRINAARVLSDLGEEGLAVLKAHEAFDVSFLYQGPAYFLKVYDLLKDGYHD